LIEPLPGDDAGAIGIDIGSVVLARGRSVNRDTEPHRFAISAGSHHQVQVAGTE
jgi:hypothetical protein